MIKDWLFQGDARLYLEGKKVLTPSNWLSSDCVTYYLGDSESKILIHDYRRQVNAMAIRSIEQRGFGWSAESFCEPSFAQVSVHADEIHVDLLPPAADVQDFPILWMGVFEGDELQANPLEWVRMRENADGRTSFVALVQPEAAYQVR